jgi:hypothetical protein
MSNKKDHQCLPIEIKHFLIKRPDVDFRKEVLKMSYFSVELHIMTLSFFLPFIS